MMTKAPRDKKLFLTNHFLLILLLMSCGVNQQVKKSAMPPTAEQNTSDMTKADDLKTKDKPLDPVSTDTSSTTVKADDLESADIPVDPTSTSTSSTTPNTKDLESSDKPTSPGTTMTPTSTNNNTKKTKPKDSQKDQPKDQKSTEIIAIEKVTKISQGDSASYFPGTLVDSNGNVHVIFGQVSSGGKKWELKYSRQVEKGFTMPVLLSTRDYKVGQIVELSKDGQHLMIVFEAYREMYGSGCDSATHKGGGCRDMYYMISQNGGATWSVDKVLPHPNDYLQRYNVVAAVLASGDVLVSYMYDSGKKLTWSLFNSTSGSWSNEAIINGAPAFSQFQGITADDDGDAYLTFAGGIDGPHSKLYFAQFSNNQWSKPKVIDDGARPYCTSIVANQSGLYIVNADQNRNQVGLLISSDKGQTFTKKKLTRNTSMRYFSSQIKESNGNFYTSWIQTANKVSKLVFKSGPIENLTPVDMPEQSGALIGAVLSANNGIASLAYHYRATADGRYQIYLVIANEK